jgi:hypothetical protein
MNKDFTLHPEALELKQLGFDEPCLAYYLAGGIRFKEYKDSQNKNSAFYNNTVCSIPLYQQAFRWFREKHNLKSWIQEHTSDTFIYEIRPHVLSDYKQGETYVYTNYEEAELACLKKLIEIVKNGK